VDSINQVEFTDEADLLDWRERKRADNGGAFGILANHGWGTPWSPDINNR